MTYPANIGLPAYGLTSNPFVLGELDPVERVSDLNYVSWVDGWKDLSDAQDLIDSRIAEEEPVFFVVDGESRTGRSSAANYLVYLWAKAHGVGTDPDLGVLVHRRGQEPNTGVYAPEVRIVDWISTLRTQASKKKLGLSPSTQQLMKVQPSTEVTAAADYADALSAFETDLMTPKPGARRKLLLAAILERCKGTGHMSLVLDSFEATQAIVVLTVDHSLDTQDLRDEIDKQLPPQKGMVLRLGTVQGAEVAKIIEDRWKHCNEGVENPFDINAAADVFISPRTIARTVKVLSEMLRIRHMHYSSGAPWPHTRELAIGAAAMQEYLDIINSILDVEG